MLRRHFLAEVLNSPMSASISTEYEARCQKMHSVVVTSYLYLFCFRTNVFQLCERDVANV